MQIPPPVFVQTDGGSTIAKKKCQRHSLRILCPAATLAVSLTLFNDNLAIQVAETKKTAPAEASTI